MDRRTGEIVASVDRPAAALAVTVESAAPAIAAVNDLSPSVMRNALGVIAAVKVTAGETAQTMRTFRDASPALVASIQASAVASQQAAASAAQTSQNLAALTKPGPRWLRYVGLGASVVVPASQVAIPFVLGRVR
jgi:hypothetical protein